MKSRLLHFNHETAPLAGDECTQKRRNFPAACEARSHPFRLVMRDRRKMLGKCHVNLRNGSIVDPVIEPLTTAARPLHGRHALMSLEADTRSEDSESCCIVQTQGRPLSKPMHERNFSMTFSPDSSIWKEMESSTAGLQNAGDFRHDSPHVNDMLHDLVADHGIEMRIRKGYFPRLIHATDIWSGVLWNTSRRVMPTVVDIAPISIEPFGSHERDDLAGPAAIVENSYPIALSPICAEFVVIHDRIRVNCAVSIAKPLRMS